MAQRKTTAAAELASKEEQQEWSNQQTLEPLKYLLGLRQLPDVLYEQSAEGDQASRVAKKPLAFQREVLDDIAGVTELARIPQTLGMLHGYLTPPNEHPINQMFEKLNDDTSDQPEADKGSGEDRMALNVLKRAVIWADGKTGNHLGHKMLEVASDDASFYLEAEYQSYGRRKVQMNHKVRLFMAGYQYVWELHNTNPTQLFQGDNALLSESREYPRDGSLLTEEDLEHFFKDIRVTPGLPAGLLSDDASSLVVASSAVSHEESASQELIPKSGMAQLYDGGLLSLIRKVENARLLYNDKAEDDLASLSEDQRNDAMAMNRYGRYPVNPEWAAFLTGAEEAFHILQGIYYPHKYEVSRGSATHDEDWCEVEAEKFYLQNVDVLIQLATPSEIAAQPIWVQERAAEIGVGEAILH